MFWDWVILLGYLVIILAIGVWAARRIQDTADFFMAGRSFRKTFMVFFTFGAGTHSDQAVSVASKTYTDGLSGIWYQWFWLFNTPFYWLFPPIFRRMRALTTADFFELRYTRSVAALFALIGILQFIVNLATMLKGCGAMITAVSGGVISELGAVMLITLLFVVYGVAGGLKAAIVTDFLQGILTIVLSFLVLPFALQAVGGISGLREVIDDPRMFSLVVPGGIGVFYIAMIAVNGLVGIVTQPHVMANCAAGKTEMDNRVGFCFGNMLKRICTIAWTLTGLCAVALYPNLTTPAQIDQTYGLMARDLLPAIMPGLVGLFIASLLATVMSSCDAWMISCSALFTENIYRPFAAPNRSQKHYVLVGRIVSGAIVLIGILYALFLESVITGLETFWKIQAMMGIAFWAGLFWRRATTAGAWLSTSAAFLTMIYTANLGPDQLPEWMVYGGRIYLPYQMLAYLSTGLLTMIVVSLITPRVSSAKLDRLYRAIRTPVSPDEHPSEPFEVPADSQPEPVRKIIDHPDFEIPVPNRTSVIGFVGVWALVGILIGSVYWIASL
ncbi:MAG: sodium:solute symporter family protein [Candidatus Omnitrophica bacterium]|nr:sodium:solute symporter family protein [Candidatus Omnitrophota bacterium]